MITACTLITDEIMPLLVNISVFGEVVKVNRFAMFPMGEGIEKSEDLSAEVEKRVAAMKK